MSDIPLDPPNPGESGAEVPFGPTRTRYQQLADEIIADLDAVAAKIPRLAGAHPATVDFVRQYQAIRLPFLVTTVSAVEQKAVLRSFNKLNVINGRDALQYMEALKPVEDKIGDFFNIVRFSRATSKAFLAADCLQVYAIAKGVARDPGSADIAALVQNMRRDLGPRGRRAAGEEEEPEKDNASEPRS